MKEALIMAEIMTVAEIIVNEFDVLVGKNRSKQHATAGKNLVRRNIFDEKICDIANQKTVKHQLVAAQKLW